MSVTTNESAQGLTGAERTPSSDGKESSKSWDWRRIALDTLPYLLSVGLLIVLAWPMLRWWVWEYTRPESYYAHGPLIPLMAGFMLWSQRKRLAEVPKAPFLPALALFIPALALHIFATKMEARALESYSFVLSLWSAAWLALGTRFVKAAWFPLAFIALMMPLPGPVLNDATLRMQMSSTRAASLILRLLGFGNMQSGPDIQMDNYAFEVDVPCSGFKTLLALFTFNAFLAAMLDGPIWKRLLLFLLCVPLALLINSVRIALIGIVGECISDQAAHVFHDYSGLIVLALGFVLLFGIAKVLGCRKFAGWAIF
jgi:exosortase